MKQAIHIFTKDVRHLWPLILLSVALVFAHAWTQAHAPIWSPGPDRMSELNGTLGFVLTVCWWFLVASAIYEEALPGDRQFWLTRPYARGSLVASKVLFAIAFINVPLFISDCILLAAQGMPVAQNLPWLLLRQLPFTGLFVLGAASMATLTRNFGQFVIGALLFAVAVVFQSMMHQVLFPSTLTLYTSAYSESLGGPLIGPLVQIQSVVLAAIAVAVIVWQYRTRRTVVARTCLVVLVVVVPLASSSLSHAFAKPRSFQPTPGVHVTYETAAEAACGPGLLPLLVNGFGEGGRLFGGGETELVSNGRVVSKAYGMLTRHNTAVCLRVDAVPRGVTLPAVIDLHARLHLQREHDLASITVPIPAGIARLEGGNLVCKRVDATNWDNGLTCSQAPQPERWNQMRLFVPHLDDPEPFIIPINSELPNALTPIRSWWTPLTGGSEAQTRADALAAGQARLVFARTQTALAQAELTVTGIPSRRLFKSTQMQ